ncbi:regulator [Candidatus Micrarchaeota archaeon]|nr:regulator [Candidatus Micrarchaeota archaeon]
MYPILEDAFLRYPMRKKVVECLLKYGLSVDKKGTVFCGEIEISPAKIARALRVDRRVVIETAQMIAKVKELHQIFENLIPKAFISGVAPNLGFEVIEIEAESHAVGIVSSVARIIADSGISIRQIVTDDPDIYPNPKLTIILDKRIPGEALVRIRELNSIKKLSIE